MQEAIAILSKQENGRTHKLNIWDQTTKPNFNFVDTIADKAGKDLSLKMMGKDFVPRFKSMVDNMVMDAESEHVLTEDEYHELFEAFLEDFK